MQVGLLTGDPAYTRYVAGDKNTLDSRIQMPFERLQYRVSKTMLQSDTFGGL